jgi:CHAD domain-containing protein
LTLEADQVRLGPLVDALEKISAEAFDCSLRPTASAGEAFQAIAISCLCRFRRNERLLSMSGDADALHQSRVALRQLRSALSIFRSICEDERFGHLYSELRWLSASTNEARDLDALIALLDDPPVQLTDAREEACTQALKALASARARKLVHDLVDWLADGVWLEVRNPADLTASAFAATALDRHRRKLRKKGHHLRAGDDEGLHELRIAAKKLRYATEFFSGIFPSDEARRRQKRFGKAVRGLQDELGELRDIALAPAQLKRRHVPRADWPHFPNRDLLVGRAAVAFERVLGRKRFWR